MLTLAPMHRFGVVLFCLNALACTGVVEPGDGGTMTGTDAGPPPHDAGVDAGLADAGEVDAGFDAGVPDAGPPLPPADAGPADVTFTVRADLPTHPISPLIYGTNQAHQPQTSRYGLVRMGGNRLTCFNWENNASNAGVDYQYQNDDYLVMDLPSGQRGTTGAAVRTRLDVASSINAALMVTVPIVDHVAADRNGGGDVRNTPNHLTTRFKQNHPAKGSAFSLTPDLNDAHVYQDEFINWVQTNAGGVPIVVSLDNEPDLWSDTHEQIHPTPVTYVELTTRTIDYAKAVKAAWPSVPVTGFVSYGFAGFVNLQNASDAAGKGEFVDYFLTQVAAASQTEGRRLVDYLDLHWYPEAQGNGRIIGTDTSAASVTARVQAPRSLWDTTYEEQSWVRNYVGGPIALIPSMKSKIAARYPGTKLAFTEWNYGGGGHISGGVAVADVLGIFGRDEVGLASYWKLNGAEPYAEAAFAAFRNFDGAGGAFGDTSVQTTNSNPATSSVYASLDAANAARVVIVAINKATTAQSAALTLSHGTSFSKLRVFTLTQGTAQVQASADVAAVGTNAFRYSMPPLSVSVLVPTP